MKTKCEHLNTRKNEMSCVWILTHAGGSPTHGPNLRCYYLAREFVKRGTRTGILSASFFHKYLQQPNATGWLSHEVIDHIDYCRVRVPAYKNRGAAQVLNQLVFAGNTFLHRNQIPLPVPNAIIVSSPPPFAIFPAVYMARSHQCPLIFEMRDLWPLAVQELAGCSPQHPYIRMLARTEKYAVKHANHFVSVKPGDHEYLAETYGIPGEHISYIPNGHPVSSRPIIQTSRTTKARFIVGYCGALSRYYALHTLIDAAKIVRRHEQHIQFKIIGDGHLRIWLEQNIRNSCLQNVTIEGPIPPSAVPRAIAEFDLAYLGLADVAVNQYGVSCNKLFDYLDQARPVIASMSVPATRNPVLLARCGKSVPAENPTALANAILDAYRESDVQICR